MPVNLVGVVRARINRAFLETGVGVLTDEAISQSQWRATLGGRQTSGVVRKALVALLAVLLTAVFLFHQTSSLAGTLQDLTDEERRQCLEQWRQRELPPPLEALVPPAIGRQPWLRAIREWNDQVIAFTKDQAYRVEIDSKKLVPLRLPNCASIFDLGEDSRALYAVCSREDGFFVMSRKKTGSGEWKSVLDLPPGEFADLSVHRKRTVSARLAISETTVLVATPEALWWRTHDTSEWKRTESHRMGKSWADVEQTTEAHDAAIRQNHADFARYEDPPDVVLLADSALYLGWDFGEFGGWLDRVELGPAGSPTGKPELIQKVNIHSLAWSEDGAVWVGAGLSHGDTGAGRVLAIEGRRVRTILDEHPYLCSSAAPSPRELRLPHAASIDGLTLDEQGRPLVVASELGVFRILGDNVVPVVEKNMLLRYEDEQSIFFGEPVGVAATDQGIFVASSSLGVFAFLKKDGEYEFSQIVLPESR